MTDEQQAEPEVDLQTLRAQFDQAAKLAWARATAGPSLSAPGLNALSWSMERVKREVRGSAWYDAAGSRARRAIMIQAIADWSKVTVPVGGDLDRMAATGTPVIVVAKLSASAVLRRLAGHGIALAVNAEGQLIATPAGQLSQADLDCIRQCRDELIVTLRSHEVIPC